MHARQQITGLAGVPRLRRKARSAQMGNGCACPALPLKPGAAATRPARLPDTGPTPTIDFKQGAPHFLLSSTIYARSRRRIAQDANASSMEMIRHSNALKWQHVVVCCWKRLRTQAWNYIGWVFGGGIICFSYYPLIGDATTWWNQTRPRMSRTQLRFTRASFLSCRNVLTNFLHMHI